MRGRRDSGETLIEILFAIVIIGLTVTALISSLATTANAGNAHRISIQADVVMRDYAEAIKAAAQGCAPDGGPPANLVVNYTAPAAFPVRVDRSDITKPPIQVPIACPAAGTTQQLTIGVDGPLRFHDDMDIEVRTP